MNNEDALLHPFDQLLDIERRSHGPGLPSPGIVPAAREKGLAVRLADWNLLFPLEDVSEIASLVQITPVPAAKPWLMGITNLRGVILSIIDLQNFLTGKSTVLSLTSRIVVIRSGDWGYGVLVNEIVGMRNYNMEDLSSTEEMDPVFSAYSTGAFRDERCSWLVLSTEKLVGDPRFQVVKKDF